MSKAPLIEKVCRAMRESAMTEPGDRVILGLSGGADSVCLLLVLAELSAEMDFRLRAVHVEHGLRDSAQRDAAFVQSLCEREGIPLHTEHVRAAEYAAEHGLSVEEAGRMLRAQACLLAAGEWDADCALAGEAAPGRIRIALAHHMEDCAETVLFQLCRGSSLAGLSGIRPVSGDRIRPLLGATRAEIEAFLLSRGQNWCEDETNATDAYTRNRIRRHILPALEQSVHGGAVRHLAEIAAEAAEAEAYLAERTQEAAAACLEPDGALRVAELRRLPELMQRRVLYLLLTEQAGRSRDIGRRHVEALLALCRQPGGSGWLDLPCSIRARRRYGLLSFEKRAAETAAQTETQADRDGFLSYTDGNGRALLCPLLPSCYELSLRENCGPEALQEWQELQGLFRGGGGAEAIQCTKFFDYDKMASPLCFRTREPGDEMTLTPGGGHKALSRLMIDARLPADIRDRMVLPVSGREVLWVPGLRDSAAYRVTPETKRVLCLRLQTENSLSPQSQS